MKNIFKIILFLTAIFCYSQEGTIVPLNTTYLDFQSGAYAKDINNELNPFMGTWYVINNNIKYSLVLQKMEHHLLTNSPTFYYYEDIMVGKYEARDMNTNTVLYSTMDATLYEEFDIGSSGGVYNGELEFLFIDTPRCSHAMSFRLYKMTFQPGTTIPYQVRYYNFGGDGYWEPNGCPYNNINDIPFPLPFGSFVLTKE